MKLSFERIIMNFIKHTSLLVGSCLFLGACSTTQLGQVPQTRENYNQAIDTSENEQFLLNLVRMHDGRSPFFVNVDSVTTQTTLTTKMEAQLFTSNIVKSPGPFWNLSPTITFTEAPTITYTPLQGTKYVSGMMTPLSTLQIGMLQTSGWKLSSVLNIVLNRIGSLDNSEISRHVDQENNVENPDFDKFIDTIGKLSSQHLISETITSYKNDVAISMQAATPEVGQQISRLLKLKKNYTQFIFSRSAFETPDSPENMINIQTSSLLGIMNFLANGVVEDSAAPGIDNFKILTSSSEPDLSVASVKIENNGKWYYIARNDSNSKATLVLLKLIYSLQLGDIKVNLPIVTIPVNH